MTTIVTVIAAAILGVFIGLLSGLLGIGGGTIMVPTFRLAFGMGALASTATSLFTIIPTSISGVITHLRRKTCIPKLGLALGIGGACTSPLGVWLSSLSPSWAVMLAAALVIVYSAFSMIRKVRALPKPNGKGKGKGKGDAATGEAAAPATGATAPEAAPTAPATGATAPTAAPTAPAPESASPPQPTLTSRQLVQGVAIGLVAGVASGYVGLGGGFLMVPLMLAWLNIPMKLASGTSLIAVMLIAIPGAITQGVLGNIDYLVGIATAVGTIPGAYLGARLVSRVPERTLRLAFAVFLAIGAALLVLKEVALFV